MEKKKFFSFIAIMFLGFMVTKSIEWIQKNNQIFGPETAHGKIVGIYKFSLNGENPTFLVDIDGDDKPDYKVETSIIKGKQILQQLSVDSKAFIPVNIRKASDVEKGGLFEVEFYVIEGDNVY